MPRRGPRCRPDRARPVCMYRGRCHGKAGRHRPVGGDLMTATALANLSGPELRALGEAADLRDLRRQHNFEALLRAPTLGAFAPGAAPLPPTSPEELGSAMSALALRCWSVGWIV